MRASVSVSILRTLLALCVSLWIAGAGCMWGCSSTVVAAEQSQNDQTVIAGSSCHRQTHDCCAKRNSSAKVDAEKTSEPSRSLFSAVPERMMGECPLAVNATAVTASKATHHTPEQARTSRIEPAGHESIIQNLPWSPPPVQFLNRGPTYLRCCVFLI